MNFRKIHRFITLIVALILGCSAGFLSYTEILFTVDQSFSDWFYDHTLWTQVDDRITIIAIDSGSEAHYGTYDTWSRELLAAAVSELSANDAAVIGLDVDLSSESQDTAGDQSLADACGDAGNVVAIAGVSYSSNDILPDSGSTPEPDNNPDSGNAQNPGNTPDSGNTPGHGIVENPSPMNPADAAHSWAEQMIVDITYPYDALMSNVTVGIANATQQSTDGSIRNAALTVYYDDTDYDSFAVAVYKTFQDSMGLSYELPQLDDSELFGFNAVSDYFTLNIINFSDLLSGDYNPSLIEDHIVLIGDYEESLSSRLENFMHPNQNQQEVLLQTSIIQALLNQRTIQYVNSALQAIFYTLLITAVYLIITGRKTWISFVYSFFTLAGVLTVAYLVNRQGYRFLLLIPALFFTLIVIIGLFQELVLSLIQKKKMEWTFKMYVDSQVVDELTERSPFELSQISERRAIAVLFVDIRGFTTISESLEPEQVVEILNEYLSLVAAAIQHWDGTLDKFIGDAAMALFNAPRDQKDYVLHAVCAAEEIVQSSDYIRDKFQARYGKTVSFGIGINCGDAIVGNIGSRSRMDYTAIGDTVNTAARLEANAEPGQILVSEAVWEAVKDHATGTYIGPLALKGKTKSVETYQINDITNPPKPIAHWEGFLYDKAILHSKNRPTN